MSAEGDPLVMLVEGSLKTFRGEEVDVDAIADRVSRALAHTLADLKTVRTFHEEVREYLRLIKRAAHVLANLLQEVKHVQPELLEAYLAGFMVRAGHCIPLTVKVKDGISVKCSSLEEASALTAMKRGSPLLLKV